ncbi:MAG: response regulator [Candidatus Omnitrophota bacterium]
MVKKILVVDDEASVVKALTKSLQFQGYDVITAASGKECICKAEEYCPDVILLDVLMPELNGLEVCKLLKDNEKTKNIPVIMLTALADEEDAVKGLEEGARCYITKPYNLMDLLGEIKSALANRS